MLSPIDLLITTDDIAIPTKSGIAKQITWRNLAEPADMESAMNGKMNDARIAIDQIAALVPISFFFSEDVITATLVIVEVIVLIAL